MIPNHPVGYITPDPGHVNCRDCHRMNIEECGRCRRCIGCCSCHKCDRCQQRHPYPRTCTHCGLPIGLGCRAQIHGAKTRDGQQISLRDRKAQGYLAPTQGRCTCNSKPAASDILQLTAPSQHSHLLTPRAPVRGGSRENIIRPVTAEIEVCDWTGYLDDERGVREPIPHAKMAFVHDGSIKGPNPIEILVGPFTTPFWAFSMSKLKAWMIKHRAAANPTCGLHIHVDAKDLSPFAMRRFLRMYQVLEPTFYTCVQPDRATKKHSRALLDAEWAGWMSCLKYRTSSEIRKALLLGNYMTAPPLEHAFNRNHSRLAPGKPRPPWFDLLECKDRAASKYDSSRYRGLNLHSWFHRGTIEFRHHEGTVDVGRIDLWAQWCRWLVELADRLTDAEVSAIWTPEDILYGVWKRSNEMLSLPPKVVEMIKGGRVVLPPVPQEVPRAPGIGEVVGIIRVDYDAAPRIREYRQRAAFIPDPPQFEA